MDNKKKNQLRRILIPLTSVLVVILLWQLIAVYIIDNPYTLPSFTQVLEAFYRDIFGPRGTLPTDVVVSLYHFVIGMVVSLLVGIPVGVGMGGGWPIGRSSKKADP